ncbi:putative HTH-type transcriptional regulator [Haemophilus influenzae]|nr:putative HTH-type transcriptional regulator [Haemophilus influenzae]
MRQAKTDLAEQIFSATDRLMAREGLNQLSMHKLAKEANVAAGTIYLYFKNKDELLEQFAHRVFSMFMATLEKDFDETKFFRTISTNVEKHLVFLTRKSHYSIQFKAI